MIIFCKRCGKKATRTVSWIDKGKEKYEKLCDEHFEAVMKKRRENIQRVLKRRNP